MTTSPVTSADAPARIASADITVPRRNTYVVTVNELNGDLVIHRTIVAMAGETDEDAGKRLFLSEIMKNVLNRNKYIKSPITLVISEPFEKMSFDKSMEKR